MGFLDRLRQIINKSSMGLEPPTPLEALNPQAPKEKKSSSSEVKKTAKELATERGEPWVNVVSVELDSTNIGSGAFELDWNDKFLSQLVRAGYQKQPNEAEHLIVDRWFQDVCRNVILENFEQEQADPEIRKVTKINLGQGKTQIS